MLMVASGATVSPEHSKGPGGDYRYYLIPAVACLIFIVMALVTGFFGLRP
jgi:hypothetical protein